MPGLGLDFQLLVDTPARIFGIQKTPPFLRWDTAGLLAPYLQQDNILATRTGIQLGGLRVIPQAGVMILEPSPKKSPTTLAAVNFPVGSSGDWKEMQDSTTGTTALNMSNTVWNTTWGVSTNATIPADSCFYARIGRGQATTPPSGSTLDGTNYWTQLVVGDGATPDGTSAAPCRLVLQDGRPPFLQQATPDGSGGWTWGAFGANGTVGTAISDCSKLFEQQNRLVEVEWMSFPSSNTLIVRIANGLETLVFRPQITTPAQGTGLTYDYTDGLSVAAGSVSLYGQNGTAQFQFLPMQFAAVGQMLSEPIDLPFTWQGNGLVGAPGASLPSGASIVGQIYQLDNSGTHVVYYLQVNGANPVDGFCDTSPIIPAVRLDIPPTFDYTATVGYSVDLSAYVGSIEEHQWYDRNMGMVRTQVGIMFDNTFGDFSAFAGVHRAVSFSRWLTIENAYGVMVPFSAPIQFLIGWTGMQGSVWKADPTRQFDCILEDNFWVESDVECGQLTYGDGWCNRAWRRFLMNMAGRSDGYISDDFKTCDFGPNPPNCPHWRLPSGVATAPRVCPHPNNKFLQALADANDMDHSIMFPDAYGIAQIMPYDPGVYTTPFKGYFNYSEIGDPTSSDFLSAMWRRRSREINTADRRTSVSFYGPDPTLGRLQGTHFNIDDFIPGFTANIQGYRKPLVKVSKYFIDPVFTAGSAYAALQKVSLPTVWDTVQGAYLPGLFALDQFAINDSGSDLSGTTFLSCEDIRSRWNLYNPEVFGSQVRGRWLANQ